jgi:hypothetical protein
MVKVHLYGAESDSAFAATELDEAISRVVADRRAKADPEVPVDRP